MKINPLNSYNKIYENKKDNDKSSEAKSKESKTTDSDKLELSEDIFKLGPVKERIRSGFYDNPDVLDQISQKLLNQIDSQK